MEVKEEKEAERHLKEGKGSAITRGYPFPETLKARKIVTTSTNGCHKIRFIRYEWLFHEKNKGRKYQQPCAFF